MKKYQIYKNWLINFWKLKYDDFIISKFHSYLQKCSINFEIGSKSAPISLKYSFDFYSITSITFSVYFRAWSCNYYNDVVSLLFNYI